MWNNPRSQTSVERYFENPPPPQQTFEFTKFPSDGLANIPHEMEQYIPTLLNVLDRFDQKKIDKLTGKKQQRKILKMNSNVVLWMKS
eukprot:UN31525